MSTYSLAEIRDGTGWPADVQFITLTGDTRIPGTDRPITAEYVQGYALGYFYGREHGDQDPGRDELERRHGVSTSSNMDAYSGFDHGYTDGVEHFVEEDDPEQKAGDQCPHPKCDLHLLWDPMEQMLYCTADWEHG